MANITFKATGIVLTTLEKILKVHLTVDGLENLDDTPTLFVVNHFTRMETFIIPYVLYKHAGMEVRSLADASLFKGLFGKYLEIMGTLSTREPLRNRTIIGDLMTGRMNWVIYPEGIMVKNKKVIHKGKFRVNTPNFEGPPRTGAAVLALKAEMEKREYLEACAAGVDDKINRTQRRFGLKGPADVINKNTVIVPINITYYPFRPGKNVLSNLTSKLFKDMPDHVEEELQIEGGLLVQDTDMNIYFDKPIPINIYLDKPLALSSRFFPFIKNTRRRDLILWFQKRRLTNRFMRCIYHRVSIHIDHLVCMALRELECDRISRENLKMALYLTALNIKNFERRRQHQTISMDMIQMITDESYAPFENILQFAEEEGLIIQKNGELTIDAALLKEIYPFHDIRLKNPLRVITNELEPLKGVIKVLKRNVNMPSDQLKKALLNELIDQDVEEFVKDHETYYEEGISPSPVIGRPFFLRSKNKKTGFVLSHGFLSAPEELRPFANYLNARGYPVYVVRLKGHGTAPRQLVDVEWKDWLRSFDQGYAIMRQYCKEVIVGGFSSGSLLALLSAARKNGPIKGVFCINTPMVISDIRSRFVPSLVLWNDLLDKFNIEKGKFEYVDNPTESPGINYEKIHLNGVHELNKMINHCREKLNNITLPTCVVQGTEDPVVNPKSRELIIKNIQSEIKEEIAIETKRHVIIRKDGSEEVFEKILDFFLRHNLISSNENSPE